MALIWWLPTCVLVTGALVLLTRIRIVEREIAVTSASIGRLAAVGEGGAIVSAAVAETSARRARTTENLSRAADRGQVGSGR